MKSLREQETLLPVEKLSSFYGIHVGNLWNTRGKGGTRRGALRQKGENGAARCRRYNYAVNCFHLPSQIVEPMVDITIETQHSVYIT